MYLSQLRLNPTSGAARRDLADPYQMHRTLSRVFADGADVRPGRFLWRLERGSSMSDAGVVLVQSEKPGHWNVLDEFPGYVVTLQADKPLNIEKWAVPGRRCRFRLAANPTVTRDGKRLGLLKEEQQLTWLSRQGQRGGFDVVGAVCSGRDRISVPHGSGGTRLTVTRVQFDGELIAREAAAFHRTLQSGIGHAKALGLGLLSLAPA